MKLEACITWGIKMVSKRKEECKRGVLRYTAIHEREMCRMGERVSNLLVKPKGPDKLEGRHKPYETVGIHLKLNAKSVGKEVRVGGSKCWTEAIGVVHTRSSSDFRIV